MSDSCPSDEQLMALATGATLDAAMQPHLSSCRKCQRRLEELRRDASALRGANMALGGGDSLGNSDVSNDFRENAQGRDSSQTVVIDPSRRSRDSENLASTVVGDKRGNGSGSGGNGKNRANGDSGNDDSDGSGGGSPAAGDDPMLPKRIGKYKVISHIGSGAQGLVVRALDEELSQDVVIKMSRRPLPRGESRWAGLADEGRLLAELKHHGLARVFYLGWHTERNAADGSMEVEYPYLVMEYVPGRNLAQYAADEHPSPMKSAQIVAKIARALAAAHQKGIVHQDIKPANILIEANTNDPRLIDFGLARFENAWARIRPVGGTVAFMAPEQAALWLSGDVSPTSSIFGDSLDARSANEDSAISLRISPRTDIFSLGAVLYYLLTGRAPYTGSTESMLVNASQAEWDREPLQKVKSPALRAIVTRAMSLNPAQRYPDAGEMAGELQRCIARPRVVRRRWFIAAALVAVVAAGFLTNYLVQNFIHWRRFQQADAWVTPAPQIEWTTVGSDVIVPIAQLHVSDAEGHPLILRMVLQDNQSYSDRAPIIADTVFTPSNDDANLDNLNVRVPVKALAVEPGNSQVFRYTFFVVDQKTQRHINSPPISESWQYKEPPGARIVSMKLAKEPDPTKFPDLTVNVELSVQSAASYQFEINLRAYHDGRLPRDAKEARALAIHNMNAGTTQESTPEAMARFKGIRTPLLLMDHDDTRAVQNIGTTETATATLTVPITLRYSELYKALGPLAKLKGADVWVAARVSVDHYDWVSNDEDPNMWLKIHLPALPPDAIIAENPELKREQGNLYQYDGGTEHPVSLIPPPDPDDLPSNLK